MFSTTKNCGSGPVSSPAISKLCGSFVAQRLDRIDSFNSRSIDRSAAAREHVLLAPMYRLALALLTLLAACSRAPLPGNGPGDAAFDARDGSLTDGRDAPLSDARDASLSDAADDGGGVGPSCAAPALPGMPDGGVRCGTSSLCDSAAARRRRLLQHAALHRRQRRERDLGRRPRRHGRRLPHRLGDRQAGHGRRTHVHGHRQRVGRRGRERHLWRRGDRARRRHEVDDVSLRGSGALSGGGCVGLRAPR